VALFGELRLRQNLVGSSDDEASGSGGQSGEGHVGHVVGLSLNGEQVELLRKKVERQNEPQEVAGGVEFVPTFG
jgi:hypothetical protein